jgi:hypothetical protein
MRMTLTILLTTALVTAFVAQSGAQQKCDMYGRCQCANGSDMYGRCR